MTAAQQADALIAAIDLFRLPSKVRTMRASPLPPGILLLLRLAAEESEALVEAGALAKRALDSHRKAAIFFIEQVLMASDDNALRLLGLDEAATPAERRRHLVYLLKWLHPDRNDDPHKARLAQRVIVAWNELKTGKRRTAPSARTKAGNVALGAGYRMRPRTRPGHRDWSTPGSAHRNATPMPASTPYQRPDDIL
jgi:hypothetical protein